MLKQFEDKMQKSLDSMANDFMTIRAGRANPHVLDKVKVDYYGVATPVAQVGNVSVPEARTWTDAAAYCRNREIRPCYLLL